MADDWWQQQRDRGDEPAADEDGGGPARPDWLDSTSEEQPTDGLAATAENQPGDGLAATAEEQPGDALAAAAENQPRDQPPPNPQHTIAVPRAAIQATPTPSPSPTPAPAAPHIPPASEHASPRVARPTRSPIGWLAAGVLLAVAVVSILLRPGSSGDGLTIDASTVDLPAGLEAVAFSREELALDDSFEEPIAFRDGDGRTLLIYGRELTEAERGDIAGTVADAADELNGRFLDRAEGLQVADVRAGATDVVTRFVGADGFDLQTGVFAEERDDAAAVIFVSWNGDPSLDVTAVARQLQVTID